LYHLAHAGSIAGAIHGWFFVTIEDCVKQSVSMGNSSRGLTAVGILAMSVGCGSGSNASTASDAGAADADAGSAAPADAGGDAVGVSLGPPLVVDAGPVTALAVDTSNLYWVGGGRAPAPPPPAQCHTSDGTVHKVPLHGQSPAMPVTLSSGEAGPGALALDAANVYWLNAGSGEVAKVSIAGGPRTSLSPGQAACWPTPGSDFVGAITVDATFVYWIFGGQLSKVATGGGASSVLASLTMAGDQLHSTGLAVDAANAYWGSYVQNGWRGPVSRMPLVADAGAPTVLADNQNEASGLVIDAANVYWANQGTMAGAYADGAIMKTSVGAAAGATPTVLASGLQNPVAVALDGTTLYWENRGGFPSPQGPPVPSIAKIATPGGAPTTLVSAVGHQMADAIAVDGTNVYWSADGNIYATPK
jgi:hypothetical protein